MPLFSQEVRSRQSTRTKIGRVVRSEGGYVDVIAVGGNTVLQKVKTGGLSPNVGDYVTVVFHSDGEKQAVPISSKEQVSSASSASSSGSLGSGGAFTAGNGLSTTIGGVTNVNTVAGRTQITSNAVDVNTSLLPTPLVGEIGRVAYVSATGQLSYSSTLSLNGVQVIVAGTSARIMGDFSSSPRVNRTLFQSTTVNGASNVGVIPNGSGTSSAFTAFGALDPDNSRGIQISGTSTEAFLNSFQTSSGTLSALALLFKINSSEAARFTANKAFLVGKTSQALPDSIGNAEFNDSIWIGNLLKVAGATGGLATLQAQATVTPTLTLPSSTGTIALLSDIPASVSGTIHYIPKFTGSNVIGNSHLFISGTDIKTTTSDLYFISERTSANAFASFGAFAGTSTYTAEAYFYAFSSSYGTAGISAFSNATLTYVSVSGHLLPGSDASQDAGSTTSRWRSLYLKGGISIYGATSGNASIVVPAIAGTPTLTLPTTSGTIALTSDIPSAYTHPNHSGDATSVGDGAITFATVNSNVGTFGSTTQSVQVTVNAKGLITGISNQTIAAGVGGSGSIGKLPKWATTSTLGDSIITESGAALSVAGALTLVGQSDTNQFILKGFSTQTSAQMLFQSSAAAEIARFYVNATYSIALGYQAGATLGASTGSVLIGYQAGNALTTNDMVAIGYQAAKSATGDANLAIGTNALKTTVTGYNNTAIGKNALQNANSSAHDNVALGYNSQSAVTSGSYNLSIGTDSLVTNQTGSSNVGVGMNALRAVTGSDNVGVGGYAGYYNSTGNYNVFIGASSGTTCLGSDNVVIGRLAGEGTQATWSSSVYIGYGSGAGASAGNYNVGIGKEALKGTVANATAIGYQAGKAQTGSGFVAIGYQAGLLSSSGTNSTLVGSGAGASLTTNGGCVMLGYQAGNAETAANKLYIANSSTTTPLIYGDFSTPSLTFNGTVNIQDAKNIVLGSTTGTKLGSATSEKLGVWGATPIVQPTTGVAAATFTANSGTAVNDASTFDGYTLKQIAKALRNIGLLA